MDASSTPSRLTLVVVEDNELDREKVERSLGRLPVVHPIVAARDGIEALELLRGAEGRPPLTRPYVVLLDMNMPRMSGLEFLAEMRSDPDLACTPVFVLTTSDRTADVEAAYRYNVAGYLLKPLERGRLEQTLHAAHAFWEASLFPGEPLRS